MAPHSQYWRVTDWSDNEVVTASQLLPSISGAVFWDIGAHFGIHTVGMAMQVGPAGQVVAVEPDATSFRRLNTHLRMNRITNVVAVWAAASDATGSATLGGGKPGSSQTRLGAGEGVNVTTVRLDDLVAQGRVRPPDLVKVDVEGHGAAVVAGAVNSIATSRPIIAFSGHTPEEVAGTRRVLEPLGYRPFRINGEATAWDGDTQFILRVPAL